MSVYRLCNPWTGEHLLTADKGEYDRLDADGYVVRGAKAEIDDLVESIQIAGTALRMEDVVTAEGVTLVSDGADSQAITLSVDPSVLGDDVTVLESGWRLLDERRIA